MKSIRFYLCCLVLILESGRSYYTRETTIVLGLELPLTRLLFKVCYSTI